MMLSYFKGEDSGNMSIASLQLVSLDTLKEVKINYHCEMIK